MSIKAIHETIAMAKAHEAKTGHLAKLLAEKIDQRVHLAIKLPQQNPEQSLLDFVSAYIENVPSFLEAARAITQQANIGQYAEPYFKVAENFFLKPPEIVAGHIGLDELMDEAYLAHRLIEEVNDRFMVKAGIPLVPMDMTTSNLIIHSLIGEPFANELDEAVDYTVQKSMANEHLYKSIEFITYAKKHKADHWLDEREQWPCLTDNLAIGLQFGGT
ncbi:hypothetical protein [Dasania marina]|uniref:hypothetical protein n=1 Tax=Dasania marina TaxID=471499 RepID=UPI0030D92E20